MPQSYLFMRVPKDFITQNDHLAQNHRKQKADNKVAQSLKHSEDKALNILIPLQYMNKLL